ncbi:Winged helix-turn helix [Azotobacter beijerinckii]|uniref:Winged helix-turn helix n=1 Tax=Azotobacter beijerinckii TaxID=170623 RepID=A0A1H6U3N5_9GAMM|nr:Winged helix-turn helix [Azotobacter beijerinckii]
MVGREAALRLIGQLPRTHQGRSGWHVMLYVPKDVCEEHLLAQILGLADARHLVDAFGGETLKPATCADVYRRFRDASILRMVDEGMRPAEVAELMGVSSRHVRNLVRASRAHGWAADRPARNGDKIHI